MFSSMPRPRLSDCERQVPTKDRASVHCFWCGQRGHFWYDKFTSKRCTNQPKLTAAVGVGGGAQQRQESGAENKSAESKDRKESQEIKERAANAHTGVVAQQRQQSSCPLSYASAARSSQAESDLRAQVQRLVQQVSELQIRTEKAEKLAQEAMKLAEELRGPKPFVLAGLDQPVFSVGVQSERERKSQRERKTPTYVAIENTHPLPEVGVSDSASSFSLSSMVIDKVGTSVAANDVSSLPAVPVSVGVVIPQQKENQSRSSLQSKSSTSSASVAAKQVSTVPAAAGVGEERHIAENKERSSVSSSGLQSSMVVVNKAGTSVAANDASSSLPAVPVSVGVTIPQRSENHGLQSQSSTSSASVANQQVSTVPAAAGVEEAKQSAENAEKAKSSTLTTCVATEQSQTEPVVVSVEELSPTSWQSHLKATGVHGPSPLKRRERDEEPHEQSVTKKRLVIPPASREQASEFA